jgi:hypothetical protein
VRERDEAAPKAQLLGSLLGAARQAKVDPAAVGANHFDLVRIAAAEGLSGGLLGGVAGSQMLVGTRLGGGV